MISVIIEDWRRLQVRQNSPKKGGKVWSHDKRSSYFYDPSMMLLDCPETNPQSSKNTLRIPCELVKIYREFTTITQELAPGRGE